MAYTRDEKGILREVADDNPSQGTEIGGQDTYVRDANGILKSVHIPGEMATEPIQMFDPTGKLFTISPDQYDKSIKLGWTRATPEQIRHERALKAEVEKESPLEYGVRKVSEAAGDINAEINPTNLLFQKGAEQLFPTPKLTPIQQEAEDVKEKQHPIIHYGTEAAKIAAPLLIPGVGEVGEAARVGIEGAAYKGLTAAKLTEGLLKAGEAESAPEIEGIVKNTIQEAKDTSLAKKILGSTVKHAVNSAIYSSPDAMLKLTNGDPEGAAETMLWGTGLGALFGGAGRLAGEGTGTLISKGASKAGELLTDEAGSGLGLLDNAQRKLLGLTDKESMKYIGGPQKMKELLDVADKEGWSGASPGKMAKLIDQTQSDSGSKLGDIRKGLDEAVSKNSDLQKFVPDGHQVADDILTKLIKDSPEIFSQSHASEAKLVDNLLQDIRDNADGTLAGLKKAEKIVVSKVKDFNSVGAAAGIIRSMRYEIKSAEEIAAQQIFHAGEMPEKYADYLTQKQRYWAATTLQDNPYKDTGNLMPMLSLLRHGGAGAALISGHPITAAGLLAYDQFKKNAGGLLGKSVSYLRGVVNNPETQQMLGGLMAKEGQAALQAHIDAIPRILKMDRIMSGTAASTYPIVHLLGSTVGKSKEQQYQDLTAAIRRAQIDTMNTANVMGEYNSIFSDGDLQKMIASKQLNTLNYLASQIPKGPAPKPFQRDEWKPTSVEQQQFLDQAAVVNDPMVVFKHYQQNILTNDEVNTLRTVYPKIYQQIVEKIVQTAYDPREPALNYNQRMQLSKLTGIPMDDGLKNVGKIQQAINTPSQATPEQQQEQQAAQGRRGRGRKAANDSEMPRPSSRPKLGKMPSLQTSVQRLTYK